MEELTKATKCQCRESIRRKSMGEGRMWQVKLVLEYFEGYEEISTCTGVSVRGCQDFEIAYIKSNEITKVNRTSST